MPQHRSQPVCSVHPDRDALPGLWRISKQSAAVKVYLCAECTAPVQGIVDAERRNNSIAGNVLMLPTTIEAIEAGKRATRAPRQRTP